MPNEIIDQNKQSSSENLKKVPWVEKQTEEALNNLWEDAEKSFYVEDAEKHVVTYKIWVVKQYLSKLYDKVKDIENVREAWIKLVEEGNTSAWIMAVQIALESLWKQEYDVGEIDGRFKKGWTTEAAVRKFQEDNGLEPDGIPGKETIRVLLEKLGDQNEEVEDPYKDVKVKGWEIDVPSDRDVKAEDLVEKPEDITVEFGEWSSVDKAKEWEDQTVAVVVRKEWVDPKTITLIVKIENEKMTVREEKEVEDPYKDVKVKGWEIDVPSDRDVKAEDLVEKPEDITVEFGEWSSVDKAKEWEDQTVTVVVRKEWVDPRNITVIVKIEEGKMTVREEKEVEDPFRDVKVREEIDKPADDKDVEAKDLLEWLPGNPNVKFKDDKWIDKTKEWEKQEVIIVVTIWDKTKEFVILATVEWNKIKLEDKEEKEKREEKEWFEDLKIDDLWTWDNDWNFSFKDWLINEETKILTVNGREIQKLEEWGNGFGYFVTDWRLSIWNFENGLLNWNWVEFKPYYEIFEENKENKYWVKYQWEWIDGKMNNWVEIVREDDLDVYLDIKEWKAVQCYLDDNSMSFTLEYEDDKIFAVNWKEKLKLDKELSAAKIMQILSKYIDKKWKFCIDKYEGYRSKQLYRKDEEGLKPVEYNSDGLIDSDLNAEGADLAKWLNKYMETHRKFKLEEYWEFDSEWKFKLNGTAEKIDEKGKKYIEYNGEKYYEFEVWINGKWYRIGKDHLYVWNFVNNIPEWHWIMIWSDWTRYEWEWKNGTPEWKWTTIWGNWNKFEWERKDYKIKEWKFTIVKPDEIKWEYDVKRDEKWIKIVSEWKNKWKYLDAENWKIKDTVEEWVEWFKLEEYWEFDSEWKFKLNGTAEKIDEKGKKYIEYNGEKYYEFEVWINGKWYRIGKDHLYVWNFVNNIPEWHWIMIWSDWTRYEWEWKNGTPEWKWTTIWGNWNKFEWERKDYKIKEWKFTIVKPDEIKWEYDVKRDEKWIKIVSEWENKWKYLDAVNWKIEEKTDSDEESDENSGENSEEGDEEVKDLTEKEYAALCKKTELTYDEIKQLVKFVNDKERWFIYLNWLTSIDKKIAAELSNVRWKLALDWLTGIDKEIAAELSKHQWELWLNWLTSIDKEIATELSKYQWDLVLVWLTSITDDVATELAKVEHLTIEKDILTAEQRKILHIE